MPGRDGTGPAGMGPMTGRATGYCVGYATPRQANLVGGRGFCGMGRGGRGRRNRFYATGLTGWQRAATGAAFEGAIPFAGNPLAATVSNERPMEALQEQAAYLENALKNLRNRIEELEVKNQKD